jgi:diadenosine tetraphosphate (Ap4A) HIT family hydrolase
MTERPDCVLCRGAKGDAELGVAEVWNDGTWRLTMAHRTPVRAFAYLEPVHHIPYLAEMDGPEAAGFGPAIARASSALREASGADLVYAYVFGGGVPHIHVHLAANAPAGVLSTALINGPVEERPLPSGATEIISRDHPDLPDEEVAGVIELVRTIMSS